MATLIESFGSVALFANLDGSFSVQDAADGANSYKTIKDYGPTVWRGAQLSRRITTTATVPSFSKADMSGMSITTGPSLQ